MKFVQIKDTLINLGNVDYIHLGQDKEERLTIFFNGSGTLVFTGDEAIELRDHFIEENILADTPPTT
jgi:hypothetical protein